MTRPSAHDNAGVEAAARCACAPDKAAGGGVVTIGGAAARRAASAWAAAASRCAARNAVSRRAISARIRFTFRRKDWICWSMASMRAASGSCARAGAASEQQASAATAWKQAARSLLYRCRRRNMASGNEDLSCTTRRHRTSPSIGSWPSRPRRAAAAWWSRRCAVRRRRAWRCWMPAATRSMRRWRPRWRCPRRSHGTPASAASASRWCTVRANPARRWWISVRAPRPPPIPPATASLAA